MGRLSWLLVLGTSLLIGPACSKAPQTAENGPKPAAGAKVEPPPAGMPDRDAAPDKTITAFLKAAQTGNKPLLSALLSTVARAETAKNGISFQLDTYQNSKFEVGKYEFVTPQKDGAHVACVWIDCDEKGNEYKHDVIWVLRKEPDGWRVVGMITRPFPDKDPVVFNYEDIPSLVAAKKFIEAESLRRDAEEERQTTQRKSEADHATPKALTANLAEPAHAATPPNGAPTANQAVAPKDGIQREAMNPPPAGIISPK
ncbi:MAG TPA: hypothetical protein VHX65_04490 [Pirellulales bacterium]|jgi:hypothetical protein|nr:hypothetical protein [Pirellulales bacterium]